MIFRSNSIKTNSNLEVILDSHFIRLSKITRPKVVIVIVLIRMGFNLYKEKN